MRLLQKVDKSILWLIKPNNVAIKNIFSVMDNYQIDKKRVIFAEPMNFKDHCSRHCCCDLFLDTFSFNAAITADMELTSGKPVLTLLGKSYSARMAASIISACNPHELIIYN